MKFAVCYYRTDRDKFRVLREEEVEDFIETLKKPIGIDYFGHDEKIKIRSFLEIAERVDDLGYNKFWHRPLKTPKCKVKDYREPI